MICAGRQFIVPGTIRSQVVFTRLPLSNNVSSWVMRSRGIVVSLLLRLICSEESSIGHCWLENKQEMQPGGSVLLLLVISFSDSSCQKDSTKTWTKMGPWGVQAPPPHYLWWPGDQADVQCSDFLYNRPGANISCGRLCNIPKVNVLVMLQAKCWLYQQQEVCLTISYK